MKLRVPGLALAAALLCAADYPPPPAPLEPYIVDGEFDPGDFGWMKGRFADASEAEKADSAAISKWINGCMEDGRAKLREQLASAGYPDAKLDGVATGALVCREVAFIPYPSDLSSFEAFRGELVAARPMVDTYLGAVRIAVGHNSPANKELGGWLAVRPLGEQMLRLGVFWGQGDAADLPPLRPAGVEIARGLIGSALVRYDHENTEWLKEQVARHGWPKISEVGEGPANSAWLLVQHADADPLFQLQALRLMEPLLATKEVSQQNYAYLYDRVMLKLAGKQRYGTQVTCIDGKRRPEPLEDETALERLRGEAGLGSLDDYLASFDQIAGACPPGP